MYLSVTGTPKSISLPEYSTFTSCGDHAVYVSTSDISYIRNQFSSLFTSFDSGAASVCLAEIDASSTKLSFSLLHLVYSPSNATTSPSLLLSGKNTNEKETGADIPSCGWTDLPCRTLSYALNTADDHTSASNIIFTSASTYESDDIVSVIRGAIDISGQEGTSLTLSEYTCDSLITISTTDSTDEVTIQSLAFTLPDEDVEYSIISITSGLLTLSSVHFNRDSSYTTTWSQPVISVSGTGKANIQSSTFSHISSTPTISATLTECLSYPRSEGKQWD